MSEDCQTCGTAMWDLDEDRNCPACSYAEPEIDLLTFCGKFDTKDCISHEDMRHLFNKTGSWEEWIASQIEQEGLEKYKDWYDRMFERNAVCDDLMQANDELFKGEMDETTRDREIKAVGR